MKYLISIAILMSVLMSSCTTETYRLTSPDEHISLDFYLDEDGVARYTVCYKNDTVIAPSKLGVQFKDNPMDTLLTLLDVEIEKGLVPYEYKNNRFLDNEARYNSMIAKVKRGDREMHVIFRLYDEGLALRYFVRGYENVIIEGDITQVRFPNDVFCFWSVHGDSEKDFYYRSKFSEIAQTSATGSYKNTETGDSISSIYLNLPFLTDNGRGKYLNFQRVSNTAYNEFAFRYDPIEESLFTSIVYQDWYGRVITLPSYSQWLVVGMADSSEELLESKIAYHLAIEEEIPATPSTHPINLYENICYNNVVLPFSRHYAGELESSSVNVEGEARSTLAHQLALHVVFNRPISVHGDALDSLSAEVRPAYAFVENLPKVWGEMKAVAGKLGRYVVVARKDAYSGNWFVGGLTNDRRRTVRISLDFLEDNALYEGIFYIDGPEADWLENESDYRIEKAFVRKGNTFSFDMGYGGGFALEFRKIEEQPK